MITEDKEGARSECEEEKMSPKLAETLQTTLEKFLENKGKPREVVDFSSCEGIPEAILLVKTRRLLTVAERQDLNKLFTAASEALVSNTESASTLSEKAISELAAAFESEYIGDAHKRLYDYLDRCWKHHSENNGLYRYPYFALVQSSGFGKSRLLRELAVHFTASDVASTGLHRLLYVNVRDMKRSTGYPPRTKGLSAYLFPPPMYESDDTLANNLSTRLCGAFDFVMQPPLSPESAKHTISSAKGTSVTSKGMHEELMVLFSGDDSKFMTNFLPFVSASSTTRARARIAKRRVMVLAVDEARALLPEVDAKSIGWFRILRRALEKANKMIRENEPDSGIFGILVDTNSKISNFVPSAVNDPSQRLPNKKLALFPPFVLTHTIDIHHEIEIDEKPATVPTPAVRSTLDRYKDEIVAALLALPSRESWRQLRRLGRPLWLKCDQDTGKEKNLLTQLAAEKLMGGLDHDVEASFNEASLNGVASMLCRVGIRPHSSSPLAAGIVADFMAVLSYVSDARDQFISSYSSDPILTLGALRVWHDWEGGLATKILPQLHRLFDQEIVDTGEIGEVVARIMLLLAMDSCTKLTLGPQVAFWKGAGEFFSVWTFLVALHGEDPTLRVPKEGTVKVTSSALEDASASDTQNALNLVKERWHDWSVCFTHFVQLVELPSEACLWAMLGRRAAGIMPRNQKAVDLVIPICTVEAKATRGMRVSMILVHVKNRQRDDGVFPRSATYHMRPGEVFVKNNAKNVSAEKLKFAELGADSLLRIYISLRDQGEESPRSRKKVERFYVEDVFEPERTSHVLCLKGLGPLSVQAPIPGLSSSDDDWAMEATTGTVHVLTDDVVKQLKRLLSPWWMLQTLVKKDLAVRDKDPKRFRESETALVEVASKPLADVLVLNNSKNDVHKEVSQLGNTTKSTQGSGRSKYVDPQAAKKTTSSESKTKEGTTADSTEDVLIKTTDTLALDDETTDAMDEEEEVKTTGVVPTKRSHDAMISKDVSSNDGKSDSKKRRNKKKKKKKKTDS